LIEGESGEEESVFPQFYPTDLFIEKRKELGSIIFNSQYQMDVSTMGGEIIKLEWINFYTDLPPKLMVWTGVDLAISQKSSADKTAIVTIGVAENGNIYVMDTFTARITFHQQTKKIIDVFKTYNPLRVVIEKNAYQAAQIQTLKRDPEAKALRIQPVQTMVSKDVRIYKLASKFQSGKIYMRSDMREMISQAAGFPKYRYKDLMDALDFAVTVADRGVLKRREKEFGLI